MSAAARSDSVLARAQLGEALRLLPDDADPALDVATRTRIERQARDVLARIGSRSQSRPRQMAGRYESLN